ncbi:MAG: hypothetical protein AB8B88_07555 [Devosiaceae bacterium]
MRWFFCLLALGSISPAQAQIGPPDTIAQEIMERLANPPFVSTDPLFEEYFVSRYAFALSVPVELNNLTRVQVAEVRCRVYSSHLEHSDAVIGSGTALIIEDDGLELEDTLGGHGLLFGHKYASWIADQLDGFSGSVDVPILSEFDYNLDGWTHGACDLILHYHVPGNVGLDSGYPTNCPQNQVDFALCVRPGTNVLNSEQRFGRVGFDTDGSPMPASR